MLRKIAALFWQCKLFSFFNYLIKRKKEIYTYFLCYA
jgi:hypothetical protein